MKSKEEMNAELSVEGKFVELVSAQLASDIIVKLDKLMTSKKLSFTQKQAVENLRDSGVFNSILLGKFSQVSVENLIKIFAIFDLGFTVHTLHKYVYVDNNVHTSPLTRH